MYSFIYWILIFDLGTTRQYRIDNWFDILYLSHHWANWNKLRTFAAISVDWGNISHSKINRFTVLHSVMATNTCFGWPPRPVLI